MEIITQRYRCALFSTYALCYFFAVTSVAFGAYQIWYAASNKEDITLTQSFSSLLIGNFDEL